MAGNRATNNTRRNVNRNTYASNMYVYDNTARRLDVQREYEEQMQPQKRLSNQARKNREKAAHMSLGYIFFLVVAMSVAAVTLLSMLSRGAEITNLKKVIAQQEKQLNTMRVDNTEMQTRIDTSLDLEEIKYIALTELGMTYPEEGQIVSYAGVDYDYVRRVEDGN